MKKKIGTLFCSFWHWRKAWLFLKISFIISTLHILYSVAGYRLVPILWHGERQARLMGGRVHLPRRQRNRVRWRTDEVHRACRRYVHNLHSYSIQSYSRILPLCFVISDPLLLIVHNASMELIVFGRIYFKKCQIKKFEFGF